MSIDWAELINSVRSLIVKVKEGTATVPDYINTLYLLLSALKAITQRPSIGSVSRAAEMEHDPAFASSDEESAFIAGAHSIIEDLSGEPAPLMRGGEVLRTLLPLLIKYVLPLIIAQPFNVVTQVVEGLIDKTFPE